MQGRIGVIYDKESSLGAEAWETFHKLVNFRSLYHNLIAGEVEVRNELTTGKCQETSAYFQCENCNK
jgi:hypothetical protein